MTKRLTQKTLAKYLKTNGIKPAFKPAFPSWASTPKNYGKGKGSDLEPCFGNEPLGTETLTLKYSGKCKVSLKFYRKRLADVDGNCGKYHLDFFRYCGAIRDDSVEEIVYEVLPQEKVSSEAEERVEIFLEYDFVDPNNLFEPRKKK